MSAGTNRSIPTPVSVPNGGTGLAAGTSGGIPAYTGATTIASSGVLAASALVIGGGAGVAPSTTTTGAGVLTALGIAPNASGGFSTLRKYSGSTSLFGQAVDSLETLYIAVTVTGAAAGDVASVTFPHADYNQAVVVSIVCSTNTVTVGFTALEYLGIIANAEWTSATATLRVSIIK